MSPVTRNYAKLLNELDSVLRKGKNLVEDIQRLELDSRALAHTKGLPDQLPLANSSRDFTVTEGKERRGSVCIWLTPPAICSIMFSKTK